MDSLRNVSNTKYEYILNLSEKGLEQLLQSLARKYYQAYVDGDVDRLKSTLSFFKEIEMILEDKQYAFGDFVNYCMLCNANFIIKTLFKNDVELKPYQDASIDKKNAWQGLAKAFNNGRYAHINGVDRINIRKLYELCNADESIDAEIMDIATALYDSFIDKEKYKNVVGDVVD